jgi:hypothetical protein
MRKARAIRPAPLCYPGSHAEWCALTCAKRYCFIRNPSTFGIGSGGKVKQPPPYFTDGYDSWCNLTNRQRFKIAHPDRRYKDKRGKCRVRKKTTGTKSVDKTGKEPVDELPHGKPCNRDDQHPTNESNNRLAAKPKRIRIVDAVKRKAYKLRRCIARNEAGLLPSSNPRDRARARAYRIRNADRIRVVQRAWRSLPATKARLRAYNAQPANVKRERARSNARASRVQFIEKGYVTSFLREHPHVPVTSGTMTDREAHLQMLELIHCTNKTILDRFNGMSIYDAFKKRGMGHSSVYVYLSRGSGLERRPGQSYAECERFLVADANPILTQIDGRHYKPSMSEYKNLELCSMALRSYDTVSAASKVEAALQHFLDGLGYGHQKLWKIAGVGKIRAMFRRCDINNMVKTGDYRPEFTVGISWIDQVRWRSTNADNVLASITCGTEGQPSKINRPKRWANTWARDRNMFSEV